MVTSAAKRRAVAQLMEVHGISERRAYKTTGFRRMSLCRTMALTHCEHEPPRQVRRRHALVGSSVSITASN